MLFYRFSKQSLEIGFILILIDLTRYRWRALDLYRYNSISIVIKISRSIDLDIKLELDHFIMERVGIKLSRYQSNGLMRYSGSTNQEKNGGEIFYTSVPLRRPCFLIIVIVNVWQ